MKTVLTGVRWPALTRDAAPVLLLGLAAVLANSIRGFMPPEFSDQANNVIWTLASLLTLFKAWQAYRHSDGNDRVAWFLVALGCALWSGGMIFWDLFMLTQGRAPDYPGAPDYGYLALAPLITCGILFLHRDVSDYTYLFFQLLRVALVFTALLILHFLLFSQVLEGSELSNAHIIVSLSFPLLYFTSVIHGLTENWARYRRKQQMIAALLLSALFLHALANAEFAYAMMALEDFSTVFVSTAWTLGFVPIFFAAQVQLQSPDLDEHEPESRNWFTTAADKGFLPLLLLGLAAAFYVNRGEVDADLQSGLLILVAAFNALLVGYIVLAEYRTRRLEMRALSTDLGRTSLVEAIPYGIVECDRDGKITYSNETVASIVGSVSSPLPGDNFWALVRHPRRQVLARRAFRRMLSDATAERSLTLHSLTAEGEDAILKVDWNHRYDLDGSVIGIVAVITDITSQCRNEEELRFLAHHDALTLLPNRAGLDARLEEVANRSRRRDECFAVLFLDLDQFKLVNDSFGHAVGDLLLVAVGERLRQIVRAEELISRHGGDEFVFIVESLQGPAEAAAAASRVLDAFKEPFVLEKTRMDISPSIGIAIFPEHGREPQEILKNADAAMYQAKQRGRNGYAFYSDDFTTRASERLMYGRGLRDAIRNDELSLRFQPQLDLELNRVRGLEALLRWEPADADPVPPSVFIPIAEELGLINEIGEWVLIAACRQLRELLNDGYDMLLAVNVSGIQLMEERFADIVAGTLQSFSLPGNRLELEITESTVMDEGTRAVDTLARLSALGVQISVDDFGTGYSSLSHLRRLPINSLKIDRSFVDEVDQSDDLAAIARSIIALGQSLRLDVVAEGVETLAQKSFLQREGCSLLQGYLYSRPLTAAELARWLREPLELN